jgi:hypothetical protein
MTNTDNITWIETMAFLSFQKAHKDLSAFCVLTLSPSLNIWSTITQDDLEKLPEQNKSTISTFSDIAKSGKSVAAKLVVVYLAAIVESYIKDVLTELTKKRVGEINRRLLGSPLATSEDEDLDIYFQLKEAEKDQGNPFFFFSEIVQEHISTKLRRASVEEGLKFLKKHFMVNLRDNEFHKPQWEEVMVLRNCIVHNKGRLDKEIKSPVCKFNVGDEIIFTPDMLLKLLSNAFNFAAAVEYGIHETRNESFKQP